jgi:transketolase
MVVAASKYEGPVYLGLPRGDEPVLYKDDADLEIGRAETLTEGTDVTIIACGPMVHLSLEAAKALKNEGIKARVVDMFTIKPLDESVIQKAAEETGAIVTVEDHTVIGGLGGAVAEVVVESTPVPMKRVGVPDCYCAIGEFEELVEKYNMGTPSIIAAAKEVVKKKK